MNEDTSHTGFVGQPTNLNEHATQVIAFADWENRTTASIASRVGKERLKVKQEKEAEALLRRRHRVADLYNREMEQWEDEVTVERAVVEPTRTSAQDRWALLPGAPIPSF